jgi:hypothetical protein
MFDTPVLIDVYSIADAGDSKRRENPLRLMANDILQPCNTACVWKL